MTPHCVLAPLMPNEQMRLHDEVDLQRKGQHLTKKLFHNKNINRTFLQVF